MSRYQFEIRISATKVSGVDSTPEAPERAVGSDPIDAGQLRVGTIGLLEDLLNSWDVLDQLMSDTTKPSLGRSKKSLLTERTFSVLGQHLWQMILEGEKVGPELIDAIQRDRNGRSLRVLISFDGTDAEVLRLMGLPWEFLYCPLGFFVSARAELVLSRYVHTDREHALDPTNAPLDVRFVLALPDGAGFGDEHIKVNRMIKELGGIDQVRVRVDEWPPRAAAVSEDLDREGSAEQESATPPDVIHLVGACTGERGDAKIFYSLKGEPPDWHPPGALIDELVQLSGRETGNGSAAGTKLVVLHLCEWTGDKRDPSENFERLAPDFIHRGIPAVLAMQYPLGAEKAQDVLRTFYEQLAQGKAIGQAVQLARRSMRSKDSNMRWFGAPVLYLRCADGPVRMVETAKVAALGGPAFVVESPVRRQLLDVVHDSGLPDDKKESLVEWVDRIAADEANLELRLQSEMKNANDYAMFVVFRNMRIAVSGDARRTG